MCNCIPHHMPSTAYTATQRRNPLPFLRNSLMPYHDSRLSDPPPARISSPPTAKEPPDLLRRRIGNHRMLPRLSARITHAHRFAMGTWTDHPEIDFEPLRRAADERAALPKGEFPSFTGLVLVSSSARSLTYQREKHEMQARFVGCWSGCTTHFQCRYRSSWRTIELPSPLGHYAGASAEA